MEGTAPLGAGASVAFGSSPAFRTTVTSPSGSCGAGSSAAAAASSVGVSSSAAVFSSTPQEAQKLASLAWNAPQFAQVPPTPGRRISWTRPATPSRASRERISLSVAISASSLARTSASRCSPNR